MSCDDVEPEDLMDFYCDACGDGLEAKERAEGLHRIEPCRTCRDITREQLQHEVEESLTAVGADLARTKRENEYFLGRILQLEQEVEALRKEAAFARESPAGKVTMLWKEWRERRHRRKGTNT